MIRVVIVLEKAIVGGTEALESSKEKLAENKEQKRVAFSVGDQAIKSSGWLRGGKLDLQKLLRILLR